MEPRNTDGHRNRLRARFIKSGFNGMNDYEAVELLLTLCIPRKDVKEPAKALVKRFGNLRGVLDARPEELQEIKGMGSVAPIALKVVKEATDLYLRQGAEERVVLNSSDRLESFWQSRIGCLKHEVFEVAYLDNRYCLIRNGVERLQEGTINHTIVYPRELMAAALRHSAAALVLAHNHPAGNATPSDDDIRLTSALMSAARTLNIEVIDHLIITGREVFSFRRNGLIKKLERSSQKAWSK